MEPTSRTLWLRTEPLHAVLYYDPQCRRLGRAVGLKGFWMGYFAARTAPLGAVEPATATAVLAVFAPGMVARALPAAWAAVTPEELVRERARRAAAALRTYVPGIDDHVAAPTELLTAAVADAPVTARPLFAANRAGRDRDDPVERLWQLTTCVREFRGDAHAAALADHGLDGCEAVVLAAATGRVPEDGMRQDRGWTDEEWAAAADRLRSRGLLDADARATEDGRALRQRIEDATDRLSARLLRPLTGTDTAALLGALEPLTRAVLDADVLPFPNPIGLPRPPA